MFYKSSGRSTVLDRIESQRNDHHNPAEDGGIVDAPGFAAEWARAKAQRETAAQGKPKLSAFEQDMLQAWSQD